MLSDVHVACYWLSVSLLCVLCSLWFVVCCLLLCCLLFCGRGGTEHHPQANWGRKQHHPQSRGGNEFVRRWPASPLRSPTSWPARTGQMSNLAREANRSRRLACESVQEGFTVCYVQSSATRSNGLEIKRHWPALPLLLPSTHWSARTQQADVKVRARFKSMTHRCLLARLFWLV